MPTFKQALKQALDIQVAQVRCGVPMVPEILKGNIVGGIEGAARCQLIALQNMNNRSDAPQGIKNFINRFTDTVIWVGDRLQPRPPEKGPPLPYIFKLNWPGDHSPV